jgi:FkbH-like protein
LIPMQPGRGSPAMQWLPPAANFREALRAAQGDPVLPNRVESLAGLSHHRLGYLEVIQLDRALAQIPAEAKAGLTPIRLAVLASSTVDHLLPAIRVASLRRRLLVETHIGTYGQYRQDLLDSSSPLHGFRPQVILFSIAAREAIASIPVTAAAPEVDRLLDRTVEELRSLWREAREKLKATVIQQTFLNTAKSLFGSYERMVAGAPLQSIHRLNERLAHAAAADGVALLDVAYASERDGLDFWFDEPRWLQGKLEIAPQAAPLYGEWLARIVAAQRGLSKKCLVLDLDNTLWGGVVGDDGIEGVVLGEGNPTGEAHVALQRYAKHLKERGIVLAVCSKNDPKIAEDAFAGHPEMVLKRSDIACFVANWEPKSGNLRHIAATLNLGLDSLVFVDDNPAERAAVREELPMIAVPELPEDVAQYARCIADAGYFEAVAFTVEDQQRGEQYAANASRDAELRSSGNLQDFLAGLKMTASFGAVRDVDLARVAQLINKTNQFNPTTRRYSLEEVKSLCADPACIALQFRLLDKLGDNGLVSAIILRPGAESGVLLVDTWVMSCRVFGRELEFEAMNIAVEAARDLGARELRAEYISTPKNGVIKDLYANLGFAPLTGPRTDAAATNWQLALDQYRPRSTHIARSPQ